MFRGGGGGGARLEYCRSRLLTITSTEPPCIREWSV